MVKQLDLLEPATMTITPEAGRNEPRLWVRRLVIWREPNDVLREIPLRPGLNIVWSPDPTDEPGQGTSLGHGAGKTLFCRLLRYVLGEDRFADETQRKHIEYTFPKGRVGGEVIVNGTPWAVIRPLHRGRDHFAVPNVSLEELAASDIGPTGMQPLLDAIERDILTPGVVDLIDTKKNGSAWPIALAWLTRDQECRFDHHLDWRSDESDSESPALSADRLSAVRALIGAVLQEELTLQSEVHDLRRKRDIAKREIADREREIARSRAHILSELNLEDDAVPNGLVGIEPMRKEATRKLALLSKVDPESDLSNLPAIRDRYEAARERAGRLSSDLRDLGTNTAVANRIIERIKAEAPGLKLETEMAETPVCPVCRVPIDEALAEGCKISLDRKNLHVARQRYQQGQRDLAAEEENLAGYRVDELRLKEELKMAERDAEALRSLLRAAETAQRTHETSWLEARSLISRVGQLGELISHRQEQELPIETTEKRIDDATARLASFRHQQANAFQTLSTFFNYIIESLLLTAKGNVSLDGNGIKLTVNLGGDRSTVAMTSLKVLAFDLAVLCMSIEGRIPLPAFLVHDSPREADMGLHIYHRVFTLMEQLEPRQGDALFQYIITTTTAPPAELAKRPWLVATLRGLPADARLLEQDL